MGKDTLKRMLADPHATDQLVTRLNGVSYGGQTPLKIESGGKIYVIKATPLVRSGRKLVKSKGK